MKMINKNIRNLCGVGLLAAGLLLQVSGCGGGAGSVASNGGIGGSGITATGSIDGFGSIFVNGIEFETDTSGVTLDGVSVLDSELQLGMIVRVTGTVDANGLTGVATSVVFDDDLQGPISGAITENADLTEKTLTVLGVNVIATKGSTVFDGTSYGALAVNDLIEVSGFWDSFSNLHATRIERKEAFNPGVSEIEIKGNVSGWMGVNQFALGGFTVDVATIPADLSGVAGGLMNGIQVEVKGIFNGVNTITATRVEDEDDVLSGVTGEVSIEGIVTNFTSIGDFKVAGQQVSASSALLIPTGFMPADDMEVEVEGEIVAGVLVAEKVEARAGDIELAAAVQSLNVGSLPGVITLSFATGTVDVIVNSQTELDDQTGMFDPVRWTDLKAGDFLEVKAFEDGGDIIATEVRLEDMDDDIVQGPVGSFIYDTQITIMGVTFTTNAGTDFEDVNDVAYSSSTAFYDDLNSGYLVKIKANAINKGLADEVEFEN